MTTDEARRILFAACVMWASARLEFDKSLSGAQPGDYIKARQEVKVRAEILDAAATQYCREIAREQQARP